MEKVDRLGWAAGFAFEACGVKIGIRVTDRAVIPSLQKRLLLPGWRVICEEVVDALFSVKVGGQGSRRGIRHFNLLYEGAALVSRDHAMDPIVEMLDNLLHLRIGILSQEFLFVHAGVVGVGGQAILIPGHSHSGKSSLVKALVDRGATFYSDEFAAIDEDGLVHPYPKPLQLRKPEGPPDRISVSELTNGAALPPLPIGTVICTRFRPGAQWRPRRLTPGALFLELFANTVAARVRPAGIMRLLPLATSRATGLRGSRGEASETALKILKRLNGGTTSARASSPGSPVFQKDLARDARTTRPTANELI